MSSTTTNLMLVSHPDDETLFGGLELLTNKGKYEVICMDYAHDEVRKAEFKSAMEMLGVEHYQIHSGLTSSDGKYDQSKLMTVLNTLLSFRDWDKVVTHNASGEYGHYRHVALHEAVKSFNLNNLYVFDKGESKCSPELLSLKSKVLKLYVSQYERLKWFDWERECIIKFNE